MAHEHQAQRHGRRSTVLHGEVSTKGADMVQSATDIDLNDLSYRSIIDFLPCYLTVQNRSLNILFTNQAFKNDFGDGIGKQCHQVYKGTLERCSDCPVQKTFQDKQRHLSEETVQFADGQLCRLVVHSAPILDAFGNVTAVIELAYNMTALKQDHKELMQLGQSIAVLSHGIKNILEGLEGGAYVVDEGIKTNNMRLSGKGWQIVRKNILEISTIVKNILYTSKERTLILRKVSPIDLAGEVKERYQEKAAAEGVELKYVFNPDITETTLDPSSIRKMLNNLVLNAIEACARDTEKTDHFVEIRADSHDSGHLKFEVVDNGVGMDSTTRQEIFKEFFSTKGSEGTGLGLAVVDKVVKEHGGKLEVISNTGQGSTFRVILRK